MCDATPASIVSGTAAARRNQAELQAHFAGVGAEALRDFLAVTPPYSAPDLVARTERLRAELLAIAGRKG